MTGFGTLVGLTPAVRLAEFVSARVTGDCPVPRARSFCTSDRQKRLAT